MKDFIKFLDKVYDEFPVCQEFILCQKYIYREENVSLHQVFSILSRFCLLCLYCNLWLAVFHYHKLKIDNDAFDYRYDNIAKGRKKKKTLKNIKRELLKKAVVSTNPAWTRLMSQS